MTKTLKTAIIHRSDVEAVVAFTYDGVTTERTASLDTNLTVSLDAQIDDFIAYYTPVIIGKVNAGLVCDDKSVVDISQFNITAVKVADDEHR